MKETVIALIIILSVFMYKGLIDTEIFITCACMSGLFLLGIKQQNIKIGRKLNE